MEISQSLELLRYTSRRERPLGAIVAGSNFSRTGIYPVREDPLPGLTPLDLICQRFIAYAILGYGEQQTQVCGVHAGPRSAGRFKVW
jgi:hypothetical protein